MNSLFHLILYLSLLLSGQGIPSPGPGAVGSHGGGGVTCGDTSVEATADNGSNNTEAALTQCIPSSNHSVVDCKKYFGATVAGNWNCGIEVFVSNTGTVLCQGTPAAVGSANSWSTIVLSGCGTLINGATYFITTNLDNGTTNTQYKVGTDSNFFLGSVTCCTLTGGAGFTALTRTYSEYLDLN